MQGLLVGISVSVPDDHDYARSNGHENKGADRKDEAIRLMLLDSVKSSHRHRDCPKERDDRKASENGDDDHEDFDDGVEISLRRIVDQFLLLWF